MKKLKKNDKGMSVIELLLVFSLAAMILVFALVSYNVVIRSSVTQSVKRLETILKTSRVVAMGKGQRAGTVEIVPEGSNVYAKYNWNDITAQYESKELICNGAVVLSAGYSDDLSTPPTIGTSSVGGKVVFNTNGKLKLYGSDATTTNYFIISRGEKIYRVIIYSETGAVESGVFDPTAVPAPGGGG